MCKFQGGLGLKMAMHLDTETLPTSPDRFLKEGGFLEWPCSSTPRKYRIVVLGRRRCVAPHPSFMTVGRKENPSGFRWSTARTTQ